jgi:hypothetical protein
MYLTPAQHAENRAAFERWLLLERRAYVATLSPPLTSPDLPDDVRRLEEASATFPAAWARVTP